MTASSSPWRIGELARRTGASPKALRLYENLGLLPMPRRQGSYRIYERSHEEAVLLIRQAQSVGFKLKELQSLVLGSEPGSRPELGRLLEAVRRKRAAVAHERQRLERQERLLAECEALLGSGQLSLDCDEDVRPGA
jgi:DNA-binding transcriptional MerR regulator